MTAPKHMNYTRYHQFEKMRRENPKLYWASATQMAMHSLAEKHGDQFYSSPEPETSNTSSNPDASSLLSTPTSALDKEEKLSGLRRYQQELQQKIEDLENSDIAHGDNTNAQ